MNTMVSRLRNSFGPPQPNPLLDDALDALDREADGNPDAARLADLILHAFPSNFVILELLNHFEVTAALDGCAAQAFE
jgi:hypothetical protein